MHIHVRKKAKMSWNVVYVVKVRWLFCKHRESQIVLYGGTNRSNTVLCCGVIDAWTTLNEM